MDWRMPSMTELRTLIDGCPDSEPGGACNIQEGGCYDVSPECYQGCGGCVPWGGPVGGGIYLVEEIKGNRASFWSSLVYYVNGNPHGAFFFYPANAKFNADPFGTAVNCLCVR